MHRTSFNLKVSLSSNDNAACAFRDSLLDQSEKLATFLSILPQKKGMPSFFFYDSAEGLLK